MHSKAAAYLTEAISESGKSQARIAREVGFPKPNMITMMKTGQTPIPIARVPALAESLGISTETLLRVCLQEYRPEILKVLEEVYGI